MSPTHHRIGREPVKEYLRSHGGEVRDATGQGLTRAMAEALDYKLDSLGRVLADMEEAGEITRDVRGRRTYRISLVDAESLSALPEDYQLLQALMKHLDRIRDLRRQITTAEEAMRPLLERLSQDLAELDPDELLIRLAGINPSFGRRATDSE